jgi:glycosidase
MSQRITSVNQIDFTPQHDVFPSPRDWRDIFMYQLLVDRFDAGQEHPLYDPKTAKHGRDRKEGSIFQGGKLSGITRRLDYIKKLGCNAIWISPPFKQNADEPGSYHGYGIQDFLSIDPRFGTTEDLRELVRQAHDRGMFVILDIVLNHTGNVFGYKDKQTPYRKDGQYEFGDWHRVSKSKELGPDDAIWPIELQDPAAFRRKGSIRDLAKADQDEIVNGDFFALKKLETSSPKVMDALIRAYKYWIAIADIDGYRIDTVKHVEPNAMAVFCNAIHEYAISIGKRNFILFGELIGDDDLIHKYIGGNTPAPGEDQWYPRFDAALDYPLYAILDEVIKGEKSCVDLRARYEHFRTYFRNFGEAGLYYVTFMDNHDNPHRPYRRFLNNQNDFRLGVLGIGFLLCNLGIPCIYYGTEQGFDGGGDNDCFVREAMFGGKWGAFDSVGYQFFNPENPIYKGIARIAEARNRHPALRYGRQYFRDISGDGEHFGCPVDGKATLAFSRILDTEEILCCLNLDTEARNDWVHVEYNNTPPGSKMVNVLDGGATYDVKPAPNGGAMVRIQLDGREMKVLKRVR